VPAIADAAAFAAGFDRTLAAHGVLAGTQRAVAFARALETAEPARPDELYWIARTAMLPDIEDLERFHAALAQTLERMIDARTLGMLVQNAPAPPRREPPPEERSRLTPPPPAERADPLEDGETVPFIAMASPEERLAERDFADMNETERRRSIAAMQRLRIGVELRRSRRRRLAARGDRLDVRATMRGAARTAGELVRRRANARRERPRPLLFLCDVSGSMVPYARAMLQYARVAALARPKVRAFAFATRLTEITSIARRSSALGVMTALGGALADYGSGTRIAAALHAFNVGFAQRGAARGGTVVILSDGWEREDPAGVGTELARLRLLCKKIVWVNPQKKHPAFEPLAAGMAAALPHLDALVEGHNLRSLEAIAHAIESTVTTT
jgi:uncharacterized protein with von Willebrand factor type A (vWA) domain